MKHTYEAVVSKLKPAMKRLVSSTATNGRGQVLLVNEKSGIKSRRIKAKTKRL